MDDATRARFDALKEQAQSPALQTVRVFIPDFLALLAAYDAQAARLAHMGTYCAFCTAEFPAEAPDTVEQIQQHVYVCPHHPMREVERDRDAMDSQATRYRVALEAQAARLAAGEGA